MKNIKTLVTIQQIISYAMLTATGILGFFAGGYWGGIVTGFAIAAAFLSILGRILLRKTLKRVNKSIKDRIVNSTGEIH